VTQNDRPSAFVDSPEDLVRKARMAVDGGNLEPQVAVLMTDLARELVKSREGHASRMSMLSASGQEVSAMREELSELRKSDSVVEMTSLRRRLRESRWLSFALAAAIAFSNVATWWASHR
jgi:phage shock protein A